ncbi:MAG: ATP-binding cassette domain-containing protein, partial [Candidatus Komeilibacteria bacterium]|nr:ATP-binding cassette domain-containing protein [Candidatus Komeilibacteria bacterium]
MITVEHLAKNYGDKKALDDVSFEVGAGEVLGFLGPNGAGKSTTMKIITGFLAPTKGTVKIDNIDIQDDSMAARAKIGYLPETVPLYTDMKVYEYLDFVAAARGLNKDRRVSAIKYMVDICGLSSVVSQTINELSKGFRQRLGLAQAMIHNPEILILDEPTSGLDPNQIVEIRELIKRLGREKTVILSTHILPEVAATCSRVIIINQGKIVASGRTDELLSGGGGKEVVQAKIRGHRDSIHETLSRHESVRDVKHLSDHDDGVSSFIIEVIGGADPQEIVFKT